MCNDIVSRFSHCQAVDHSLKSVNLSHGNVGNKQVKKYSGGMKRRLSVAISLIGDPKVFFLFLYVFPFHEMPSNHNWVMHLSMYSSGCLHG